MATTTAFEYRQGNPDGNGRNSSVISGFATIDNGETATLPIYCGGRALVRLGFPSAFTGTTVTFTVQAFPPADPAAPTADPSFRPLYDDAGNQVSVTVSTDRSIEVPELSGAYAFTIVSGSAEAAARRIEVQCIGSQPTTPGMNKATIEGGSITVNPITATTSNGYGTQTAVTRAANTTPYSANDVVGGAIDFGVMGPSASQIIITSTLLEPRITAVPAGMTSFTLYLYSVTPPSAIADNGAWTLASGDLASYLGSIALGTPALPAASSAALIVEQANIGKQVKLAGTHLFGYLVTAGAYTPAANSEVYEIGLQAVAV